MDGQAGGYIDSTDSMDQFKDIVAHAPVTNAVVLIMNLKKWVVLRRRQLLASRKGKCFACSSAEQSHARLLWPGQWDPISYDVKPN